MPKFIEQTHMRLEFSHEEIEQILFAKARENGMGLATDAELTLHARILDRGEGGHRLEVTVAFNRKTEPAPDAG